MSDAIAETSASGLIWEQAEQFIKQPLLQLPLELRLPTWRFWSFFADPLTSQLSLASRICYWLEFDGLTHQELFAAFDRVRSPKCSSGLKFPTDVLGALADAIETGRQEEREAARKSQLAEQLNTRTAGSQGLATNLADRFTMPSRKDAA